VIPCRLSLINKKHLGYCGEANQNIAKTRTISR
jgi:hypothetical protein